MREIERFLRKRKQKEEERMGSQKTGQKRVRECTVETRKFKERVLGTKKKIERMRSVTSEKEGERDRNEEC